MLRQQPRIISNSTKAPAPSQFDDWHDLIGHHRYYGSSAIHGERITESRRGLRPRSLNVCGLCGIQARPMSSPQIKRGGIAPAAPNC